MNNLYLHITMISEQRFAMFQTTVSPYGRINLHVRYRKTLERVLDGLGIGEFILRAKGNKPRRMIPTAIAVPLVRFGSLFLKWK